MTATVVEIGPHTYFRYFIFSPYVKNRTGTFSLTTALGFQLGIRARPAVEPSSASLKRFYSKYTCY
jgi:hypothetical protein